MEVSKADPCEEISKSSAYVREWMARQPAVKEESLSDWLLYDISSRLPNVYYHAFNRVEEGRVTGADWEWWILFPDQHIRMRVQAKKAFDDKDNYSEIARTNKYGLQIDKLMQDAATVNAIPLYALFSSTGHASSCKFKQAHPDGVYLAGAEAIYNNYISGPRIRVEAADLISDSIPFSCFACCPLSYRGADGAARFVETYFPQESEPNDSGHSPRGLHLQLPAYVTSLLEFDPDDVPDWWEREFVSSTEDFRALLVYDFRDRNV